MCRRSAADRPLSLSSADPDARGSLVSCLRTGCWHRDSPRALALASKGCDSWVKMEWDPVEKDNGQIVNNKRFSRFGI